MAWPAGAGNHSVGRDPMAIAKLNMDRLSWLGGKMLSLRLPDIPYGKLRD